MCQLYRNTYLHEFVQAGMRKQYDTLAEDAMKYFKSIATGPGRPCTRNFKSFTHELQCVDTDCTYTVVLHATQPFDQENALGR
jgi:hypothetical protein